MARKRPNTSTVTPPQRARRRDLQYTGTQLTRAEEHALARSAPLTAEQFKLRGRLADQGLSPLGRD